jgi:hypothetical protein
MVPHGFRACFCFASHFCLSAVPWLALFRRAIMFSAAPMSGDDIRLLTVMGRIDKALDSEPPPVIDDFDAPIDRVASQKYLSSHFPSLLTLWVTFDGSASSPSSSEVLECIATLLIAALRVVSLQKWTSLPVAKRFVSASPPHTIPSLFRTSHLFLLSCI